jgi:hypothetical protein
MLSTVLPQTRTNPVQVVLPPGQVIPPAKFSRHRTRNNHPLTTPQRVDTRNPEPPPNSPQDGPRAIFVQRASGKEVKAFRVQFNISARGLAQMLNYSRGYVKRIEGNSLRASAKFSEKFFAVRSEWANTPAPTPKPLIIIGPGTLADDVTTLVLSVRPRRCKWSKCHCVFVPRDRRQKFCSDAHRDAQANANARRSHKGETKRK